MSGDALNLKMQKAQGLADAYLQGKRVGGDLERKKITKCAWALNCEKHNKEHPDWG